MQPNDLRHTQPNHLVNRDSQIKASLSKTFSQTISTPKPPKTMMHNPKCHTIISSSSQKCTSSGTAMKLDSMTVGESRQQVGGKLGGRILMVGSGSGRHASLSSSLTLGKVAEAVPFTLPFWLNRLGRRLVCGPCDLRLFI